MLPLALENDCLFDCNMEITWVSHTFQLRDHNSCYKCCCSCEATTNTYLCLEGNLCSCDVMSRNRIALIFAGVFLAIALVAPIVFLFEESSAYQTDLANLGPNLADETQATNFLNNLVQRHTVALTLLVIIETVSIVLCAVALYFALKTAEQ